MSVNEIIEEIVAENSLWMELITNTLGMKHAKYKNELLSEISIYWLENPHKLLERWGDPSFKYYLIRMCQNQVYSSSSPFARNNKEMSYTNKAVANVELFDTQEYIADIDSDGIINDKLDFERKINLVDEAIKFGSLSWIEGQMFREYYYEHKSYRKIEQEYGIDHCSCWKIVKAARSKVQEYCEKNKSR